MNMGLVGLKSLKQLSIKTLTYEEYVHLVQISTKLEIYDLIK
jgi:hypothetical protein